jgi:hypothetical protein
MSCNEKTQKTSYQLVSNRISQQAIARSISIDAGSAEEADLKEAEAQIPAKLLDIVFADAQESQHSKVLGHLLGWLILLRMLENSNARLKSAYCSHLRKVDALLGLFPRIFRILNIGSGQVKPFNPSRWQVSELKVSGK